MSETLTPADFTALDGPLQVEVRAGDARTVLDLVVESVSALPPHRLRTEPFSLLLRGPRAPMLTQGTYPVTHPRLGTIELFLVPVGQDANGTRYEATFN